MNSPACRSYKIFSHFNLSVRIFYLVKFSPACGSQYRISVSDNSLSRDGNIIRISPQYTRLYTFWHLYIADSARIKWLCCWYSWHCIRLNNNGTIVASVLHASSRTLHWRYQRPAPSTLTPILTFILPSFYSVLMFYLICELCQFVAGTTEWGYGQRHDGLRGTPAADSVFVKPQL